MTLLALALLAVLVAPHALAAWRGIQVGRTAISSHRASVHHGIRIGRWQTIALTAMTLLLIGAHR